MKIDKLDMVLISVSMFMIGTAIGIGLCKFVPGFWRWVL